VWNADPSQFKFDVDLDLAGTGACARCFDGFPLALRSLVSRDVVPSACWRGVAHGFIYGAGSSEFVSIRNALSDPHLACRTRMRIFEQANEFRLRQTPRFREGQYIRGRTLWRNIEF
jgi:hypothetical protein